MIRKLCIAISALLVSTTVALGQQSITVDVDVKASAAEQLRYAQSLTMQVGRARTEQERQLAVLRAASAFDAVRKHWPSDATAYLQSALLQSDLFLNANAPENVLRLLEPLRAKLHDNPNEAGLLRRLGTAYGMANRNADAERAFAEAVQSKARRGNAEQSMLVHRAAAQFYSRTGRGREAAAHWRQIMRNSAIADGMRADAALHVLRESLHANDRAAARADLAEVTGVVHRAAKAASPDVAKYLDRELAIVTRKVDSNT